MALRNPYIVGSVVRESNFYGRKALIDTVLDGNDPWVWVVGNRRIGKTSLLFRLEQLGNTDGRIAFRISMEAAESVAGLTEYFIEGLDSRDQRLKQIGVAVSDLQGKRPHEIIQRLDQ